MKKIFLFFLMAIGVGITKYSLENTGIKEFNSDIAPPKEIDKFAFGYNDNIADVLWIRWIQDVQHCGKEKEEIDNQRPAADSMEQNHQGASSSQDTIDKSFEAKYVQEEKDWQSNAQSACNSSWSFALLDAVTKLAPKFRMPYAVGATTLSVLTYDVEGATVIFDRGIKNFPTDWKILFRAGYHYLYELNQFEKAAELYSRAKAHGAPFWAQSLAARLYSKAGRYDLAIATLEKYYKELEGQDKNLQEFVKKRIVNLKARRDSLAKDNSP